MARRERIREERRQKVKERGGKDSKEKGKEKERHYRKYKKKKKRESRDKDQQGAPTEKLKSHPDVVKSFKRPPPLLLLCSLPLNSTGRNGSDFNRIPLETTL